MPQLTLLQRGTIARLLPQGFSFAAIAREIGVNRSTVKREVERNCNKDGSYHAPAAEQHSRCRKAVAGVKAYFSRDIPMSQGGRRGKAIRARRPYPKFFEEKRIPKRRYFYWRKRRDFRYRLWTSWERIRYRHRDNKALKQWLDSRRKRNYYKEYKVRWMFGIPVRLPFVPRPLYLRKPFQYRAPRKVYRKPYPRLILKPKPVVSIPLLEVVSEERAVIESLKKYPVPLLVHFVVWLWYIQRRLYPFALGPP
ncbi:helix-turn-helix domain-containing protein [Limibacter armeniacum]|uniref:helix-turn-helix domain-containing protein n=1 Tax=Limibacter armeniacum TaxID=466084 RepID=UPI002FE5DDCF